MIFWKTVLITLSSLVVRNTLLSISIVTQIYISQIKFPFFYDFWKYLLHNNLIRFVLFINLWHIFAIFITYLLFVKLTLFLLPQINGCTRLCRFWVHHPIDGLFWSLPIYLLSFFSKYGCWITDLIMPLYQKKNLGCHFLFVSWGFILLWNVFKKFMWLFFKI